MVSARSHRVSRVPWYSGSCRVSSGFGYGALTLSGRLFQSRSPAVTESLMQSEPRDARITVWALPRSLAATYGIECFFLFLRVLRCFSSPGSPHAAMDSLHADRGFLRRVSPFRYLRINGYVLLPEAFRSLSRLSSALSAKASTLRPYYFNRSRNDRIT